MIKLQDFARECGVTDRAIQKHLKNYAKELDGLYQRHGPNGTWLTEEACEILRGKMLKRPAAIIEEDKRVPELEARVRDLEKQLHEKEALVAMAQQQVQTAQSQVAQLQEKVGRIAALEEGNKRLEASVEEYKARAEEAEAARQQTVITLEQIRTEAHMHSQNACEAEEAALQERLRAERAEAKLAEFEALPVWKRLFWKG